MEGMLCYATLRIRSALLLSIFKAKWLVLWTSFVLKGFIFGLYSFKSNFKRKIYDLFRLYTITESQKLYKKKG